MSATIRRLLAVFVALVASHASASFHLLIINEIYSNADGTIQYVELRNTGGNTERFLGGHTLTSTSTRTGVRKTFTFPTDLPGDPTNKKVLIATQGFADLGLVTPDYICRTDFSPPTAPRSITPA